MTELMPSLCNDCVARNQCGKDDVKMCISYTKEIKIKCDDCKFVEDCVDYGWEGCKKFTQKASEPLTNEEYIKLLNTEQLAEFISKIDMPFMDKAPFPCGDLIECSKNCGLYSRCVKDDFPTNKEVWVEWLKQPHTTEE